MPRPVISVDTIGRLQRTARSHESLADHLNTDEQLQLVLDRHDELLDRVQRQLDDEPAGASLGGVRQPTTDLSSVLRQS
jgi:hypothetical protein